MLSLNIVTISLSFSLVILGLILDYKWDDKRTKKFKKSRRLAFWVSILLLATNLTTSIFEHFDKKKEDLIRLDEFIHNSHIEKFQKYERLYGNLSLQTQLLWNADDSSKKKRANIYTKYNNEYFEFQYQIGRSIQSLDRFTERVADKEINKLIKNYIAAFEISLGSVEVHIDPENLKEYPKINFDTVLSTKKELEKLKKLLNKKLK